MFVFTAKLSRKKLVAAILALVVLVAAIVLLTHRGADTEASSFSSVVAKTNDDRVAFLNSLGWLVAEEPIEEQTIIIPTSFTGVYSQYNELQLSQGFDLTKYAGVEAVRYTYSVRNYPSGEDNVVADMIVYRGRVIAGDIQSVGMDGFMTSLAYPTDDSADM